VTQLGASTAVNGASTAGDSNARRTAPPSRAEPETRPPVGASNEGRNDTAGGAANNAANPVASGGAAPARRPSPPERPDVAGDLSRQCEAAAQRGDCATVRRLVDQITRTDRGYRARVAKNSPVGKCLTE